MPSRALQPLDAPCLALSHADAAAAALARLPPLQDQAIRTADLPERFQLYGIKLDDKEVRHCMA